MTKILVVTAHPDDETFGPGATIAKYAASGAEIHLLCATRGEAGQWSEVADNGRKLGEVREQEHRRAARILGIKKLEYLDYIDGTIANEDVDDLINKVKAKAEAFRPELILTFDLGGISGHLDHIAMSVAATKAFDQLPDVKKLYYFTVDTDYINKIFAKTGRRIFGRKTQEITTLIDVKDFLPIKMRAAKEHKTQKKDFDRLMPFWEKVGQVDRFVLTGSRVKTLVPEDDLFTGIK